MPSPTVAPSITSGGLVISVSVTMSHSLAGATIYYRAASDTTTDLSAAIDPNDNATYTGTGTTATPAAFGPGDVYRIKAMAVLADGRRSPETAIQRFDYDIDSDDDGLIEIRNLDMFDDIRLNLAGTSYNGVTTGGPTSATANCPTPTNGVYLCGYELMVNLDFAHVSSYASAAVNTTWCPGTLNCIGTTQAGFPGIGAASGNTGGFNAIFEGNGNTISNFYSRNTGGTAYTGLFNSTDGTAQIRSLGVTDGNVYGGAGDADNVGVLVGRNRGSVIASSASGDNSSANGGSGNLDSVGGLVGRNEGTVIASYGTGSATGGAGSGHNVGGLVGHNNGGTITAGYATGDADGGGGTTDFPGGLVGNNAGTITASYATGSADGGAGTFDFVGGLAGNSIAGSTIIASYATASTDGGADGNDTVGTLVGNDGGATITESYGFGTVTNEETDGSAGSTLPTIGGMDIISATQLNASGDATTGDAGASWSAAANSTNGAWNFAAGSAPALNFADYDGSGAAYHCASAMSPPSGAIIIPNCGMLIPEQPGR